MSLCFFWVKVHFNGGSQVLQNFEGVAHKGVKEWGVGGGGGGGGGLKLFLGGGEASMSMGGWYPGGHYVVERVQWGELRLKRYGVEWIVWKLGKQLGPQELLW